MPVKIERAQKEFLSEKKLLGRSPATLKYYRGIFSRVDRCCPTLTMPISQADYTEMICSLRDDPNINDVSVVSLWRGIRAFLIWAKTQGYQTEIRFGNLTSPEKQVRPLTEKHIKKIWKVLSRDNKYNTVRTRTVLIMIYDSGFRLSELAKLKTADLDLDQGFAHIVQAKGAKDRVVPLSAVVISQLKQYQQARAKVVRYATDHFFLNERTGGPLGTQGIHYMFRLLRKKVKIDDNIRLSAHTLRHSFALAYVEKGGDPYSLQRILGHTTQAMTKKYVNMSPASLIKQHKQFSPAESVFDD